MSQVVLELIEKYENIMSTWNNIKSDKSRWVEINRLTRDFTDFINDNAKNVAEYGTETFKEQCEIFKTLLNENNLQKYIDIVKNNAGNMLPNEESVFPVLLVKGVFEISDDTHGEFFPSGNWKGNKISRYPDLLLTPT